MITTEDGRADRVNRPANVRDVGGLPLIGGGVTASGVLLRGDALYDGDGPPELEVWPPAAVIDLRSAKERAWSPYPWPSGTSVHHRQLYDAADLTRMPGKVSLAKVYQALLIHAGAGIAGLPELLAQDGPTYVHCAVGKDRTGVSIAALLLLAGVPEDAVLEDYQHTSRNMEAVLPRLFRYSDFDADLWDPEWATTPVDAIAPLVEAVTKPPGGPREWFLTHGASEAAVDRFVHRITGSGSARPTA